MAKTSMSMEDLVGKLLADGSPDMLREILRQALSTIMEVEISQLTGAELGERTEHRQTYRNGYRERPFDTRVGTIPLAIPKPRTGSYLPSFLEPRRRAESALFAVIQEAYVLGVSTRKVEDLMQSLGIKALSKSEVSRICAALDEGVMALRAMPLTDREYPYVWLDALYLKVREGHRVVSVAHVVAYALNDEGYREVIGTGVGTTEDEAFWTLFLRELVARGLHGVQLVISDAHEGLKAAIAKVFTGVSWQRCMVHFLRNVITAVPKHAQGVVGAAVRTIFAQPDYPSAKAQLRSVSDRLKPTYPRVAEMLDEAEEDILAYLHFPEPHWRQIRCTNLLERLNREIRRRTDVVGIFPNREAVLRLVGAVLIEQNEEWTIGKRYMSLESLALLKVPRETLPTMHELALAQAA